MDHLHEQLYWAIRKWVLVHEDADDVLQLTYVRIYKGLGKFAFKSAFKTWFYRIAYNDEDLSSSGCVSISLGRLIPL